MNPSHLSTLRLVSALGLSALAAAHAAPQTFDFKDPKGVNNVQFQLDAPLESITGTATGISGTIKYDPAAPEQVSGRIVLDTNSLTVGNPMMADHLRGEKWLDVKKHPTIVFQAQAAKNVRTQGTQTLADITGTLTVKGITKVVNVPVSFTHLPDKLGARVNNPKLKGDLLVLRASFQLNRSDFDLQPGQMADKVAETINLSLSIAGASPRA
jgi:polyisoprenoid-binding protein YceI